MWSETNERWVEGATPHLRMGPPLNGRSSHLIEAAKRGRLDQMIFFSAPLTTRAPPRRPAGRPAERPAERPTERPATYPPHPLGWLGVWDCSVLRCTRWVLALLGALCVQPVSLFWALKSLFFQFFRFFFDFLAFQTML